MKSGIIKAISVAALLTLPATGIAQTPSEQCKQKQGKGHWGTLTLTLDVGEMVLKPKKPRCVAVGDSFEIKLDLRNGFELPDDGDIRITAKEESLVEYASSFDGVETITVTVTNPGPAVDPESEHGYNIEIEGHGQLDPMVRIVDSGAVPLAIYNAADVILQKELGLSVDDLGLTVADFGRYYLGNSQSK